MPTKITKLTQEQREQMPGWAEKYIRMGLSCEEADWETSEKAITECYQHAGLEPPKTYIRVSSPLVLALAAPMALFIQNKLTASTTSAVHSAVGSAVDSVVGSAVSNVKGDAVYSVVRNAVRSAVYSVVGSAVSSAVDSAVGSAVSSAVYGAVDGAVRSAVRSVVGSAVDSAVDSAVGSAVDSAVDSAVYSAVYSAVGSAVGSAVRNAVGSAVYSAVGSAVGRAVSDTVYRAVDSAVGSAVDSAVDSAVYSAVYSAVSSAVRNAVSSAVRNAVGRAVSDAAREEMLGFIGSAWSKYFGGCFWVGWIACESFLRRVCDLDLGDKLSAAADSYERAQVSSGWWYPTTDFVMICDRPEFIKLEDGRLHSAEGNAIQWRDGWGIAAWRGTTIPTEWVTGNPPPPQEILRWENIEQRRAACEIVGWVKILEELNAVVVDAHPNPEIGTLLEVDLPDSGKERFLRVTCGTGRDNIVIPVPPTIQTALNANAWSYGLEDYENEFEPEVRT